MSKKSQIQDYISISALLLNTLMLFLVLAQIKKTAHRDYVQLSYSSIELGSSSELLINAKNQCLDFGIQVEYGTAISDANAEAIYNSKELQNAINRTLNELDKKSIGILCGAIDHDIAYELNSSSIIYGYKTFEPYIEYFQKRYKGNIAWSHLKYLAIKWTELRAARKTSLSGGGSEIERLQKDMVQISPSFTSAFNKAIKRCKIK